MKVTGKEEKFNLINTQGNRIIVSYGKESAGAINSTWHEVSLSKDHGEKPTLEAIKKAIEEDINVETNQKILEGYEWTVLHGDDVGKTVKVWLSKENQNNIKAKHDAARDYPEQVVWPMVYKIGEQDGKPVYENFGSQSELARFYVGSVNYIEKCCQEGWKQKDTIDWSSYEDVLRENRSAQD